MAYRGQDEPSDDGSGGRASLARGAGWCFAAGLCALWATPLVALFGAYGVVQATIRGGRRERAVCGACLLASDAISGLVAWALFGAQSGVSGLLAGLVPSAVAFAVGCLVASGDARFGHLAGCVLAAGALLAGSAQYDAAVQGTNVAAQFASLLDGVASQATSLSQTAAIARLRPFVSMLWPAFYVGEGFVEAIIAHVGARMALRHEHVQAANGFATYDLPLWVLEVLLAGIVCLIVGGIFPPTAAMLYPVGWNVIMVVRFAFAAQGFAVLEWTFEHHGVRIGLQVIAIVALAYVELAFFVMSIVGVIDVWANFRHLRRAVTPRDADDRQV